MESGRGPRWPATRGGCRAAAVGALFTLAPWLGLHAQEPDTSPSNPLLEVGSDVVDGGVGFARDLWAVVSFPSRLDGRGWAKVGGVLGVGLALYTVDAEITAATLRQAGHQPHDAIREVGDFFEPVGLMGNTNAIWAAGIVAGYLTKQEWLRAPARDLLVSHWVAGLTRNPVRDFVGRRRPSDGFGARTYVRNEGTSFPSGHASTIVQVATILSHHIDRRWASAFLYGAAATVLFQRVDDEKHWASDTWIGAAWGWGVARTILRSPEGESSGSGVGLALVPGPGGLGLALKVPLR